MKAFSIQNTLSLAIAAAFIAALFLWMLRPPGEMSPAVSTVVNLLLGALIAKFTDVMNFYFGSNKDSSVKNQTISDMAAASKSPANGVPAAPAVPQPPVV